MFIGQVLTIVLLTQVYQVDVVAKHLYEALLLLVLGYLLNSMFLVLFNYDVLQWLLVGQLHVIPSLKQGFLLLQRPERLSHLPGREMRRTIFGKPI